MSTIEYRELTTFVYRIGYQDYVINQLVTQRYNQRVINIDIQLLLIDVWFYDSMVITNINHMSESKEMINIDKMGT